MIHIGRFNHIKNVQNKIKNSILESVLNNQDLLKFIYYNSSNPLNENEISDPTSLINTHIFKKSRIIGVTDTAQSFLIIRLTNGRLSNNNSAFKNLQLILDVICHDTLIDNLDNGNDRMLCILDELDDIFNDSKGLWVGRMSFDSCKELYVNESFSGYRLIYNITDFN